MFLCHSVLQMLDISPLKNPLGYNATGVHIHYRKEMVPTQQMAALPLGRHESNNRKGVKEGKKGRENERDWHS